MIAKCIRAFLLVSLASPCLWSAGEAQARDFPFTGTLEIAASVGTNLESFELVSVAVSGTANVADGIVAIPAGAISVPIPSTSGFSGTLVNGAASFAVGGAGPGSTCPLVDVQEICIAGGGFGGSMLLGGVQHAGQELVVWGAGGTNVASTSSGVTRTEAATLWTDGNAAVWYYVPELDPTPFLISRVGTFRGLPSTFGGPGVAGLTLVTPMMVTAAALPTSTHNVRGVAKLRIDFVTASVPTAGATALAILLAGVGGALLWSQRSS